MDIHRCRFVPYQPQAITALAFSHVSNSSEKAPPELRLALGRESGDVEIWNPLSGKWLQESILRSSGGRTVDQVAWTRDLEIDDNGSDTIATPGKLRLFSSDGTPAITEWDIARGTKRRHAEGNFGDIWCFAAQPAYKLPKDGKVEAAPLTQMLVGGCGDGSILLFSTEDDDLRFLRVLAPSSGKRQKILSITWRNRNTVVAGFENGTIKIFDVNERRMIRMMTLGKTPEGTKSIVWALKCLPDGTILSGDSSGELKIWDAGNFSCTQRLKTHQGDILDIVSNAKGDLIFTVAVDRRTVAYKPMGSQPGKRGQRWTRLMHRRYHEHDIKCAASYESKGASFLVSGGLDTTPVVLPMQNWQSEYHRALSHLPQRPQMSVSRKLRLLLSWWQQDFHIHHISKRSQDGSTVSEPGFEEHNDYEQLATLRLKGDEHIQSAQISHDGSFIVASTTVGVRLFQLRKTTSGGKISVRTRPLELPNSLRNFGARHVGFSEDGKWLLAIRHDDTIMLAKLIVAEDAKERPSIHEKMVRLSHKTKKQNLPTLGGYTKNINNFIFSEDSRVLVIADLSGSLDAWVLEGQEDLSYSSSDASKSDKSSNSSDSDSESDDEDESDSPIIHGQRWVRTPQNSTFPNLDSPVLAMSFRPPTEARNHSDSDAHIPLHPTRHNAHPLAHVAPPTSTSLVAITAHHTIVEVDVLTGKLTPWSRRNPSSLLPPAFTRIRDRVMGMFWDTTRSRQRLWMYGAKWMYMLDLAYDLPLLQSEPTPNLDQSNQISPSKKRKRRHSRSRDKGTGAGGHIKPTDRESIGFGTFGLKYKGTGQEEGMDLIDLENRLEPASDDDDNEYLRNDALVRLRRGLSGPAESTDVEMTDMPPPSDMAIANGEAKHSMNRRSTNPAGPRVITHYSTFHYRDIFGIGVLSSRPNTNNSVIKINGNDLPENTSPGSAASFVTAPTSAKHQNRTIDNGMSSPSHGRNGKKIIQFDGPIDESEGGSEEQLEIIIVERPMHDVELPERFESGQDWDA